jgi:putative membrane protein insertion efficiency factor
MQKMLNKFTLMVLLLVIITAANNSLLAQQITNDLALILNHAEKAPVKRYRAYTPLVKKNSFIQKINPVQLTLSGLMYFYQNVLSSQFNAECLYTPSCSEYGKCAIKHHGILKGMLLTSDRLFRCNRMVALEIYKNAPNTIGRYADDCKSH